MLVPILLFLLGLVLLIKGGDWFVDGATVIARKFHLPDILIGATVVSIGTTLPEVMVSATSAVGGHGEIAYGNAIGSIICNTALIAAITITFKPAKVDRNTMKLPVIFFFIAAVLYCLVAYLLGYFYWWVGAILLLIFVVYMFLSVRKALKTPQIREDDPAEGISNKQFIKSIILLVVGAALIAIGADLLVDNGIIIAEALGVPEAVIALTFIAIGTSLPELVTAITSLVKGHGSLSLGNIIGANIFNLVLVSGLSTVLSPFPVPNNNQIWGINSSLVIDLPIMMLVMVLLTIPSLIRGKLSRWQGIVLLLVYAGFCALQFTI